MVYTLTVHLYANDDPKSIDRIKLKLTEAARVYRKDKETVDWFVMQDVHDPRAFTVVERFEQESVGLSPPLASGMLWLHAVAVAIAVAGGWRRDEYSLTVILLQSQKYHLENPYWKTFDP